MLKEFKDFILTGNVIDFAIAVILAGAVGAVVNGFVGDIMMPTVGHFSGGIDFADKMYELDPAIDAVMAADGTVTTKAKPANSIMYGKWLNTIISLIVVGFVLFMMSKAASKAMKKKEEAPAPPPANEVLLGEIRDLLKK